jgi:alpha-L-fucosidase
MHKEATLIFSFLGWLFLSSGCKANQQEPPDIVPNAVVPSAQQLAWQQMELIGFIHFTVNTFTNREWGLGTEKESVFNPSELDARQWVSVAKEIGMKELIITAKHHDGFCLWPSAYTTHSVIQSPWKDGKGDVVKALAEACKASGLKLGIYLSPWDRHEPCYGTNAYNQYYMNQLTELLTNYGEVSEVWMDGAKGENAKNMEYDFKAWRALIRKLQPNALIFSDAGPDIRWIGNENGFAGETNWSTINNENLVIGKADGSYLNRGDPNGLKWIGGECDVSVRPGWFWHASEDLKVKSPRQLVDIYYKSVGRNAVLLLNIPPNSKGLVSDEDIASLREFRSILDETFKRDLSAGGKIKASNTRLDHEKFSPSHLLDDNLDDYWATDDSVKEAMLELILPGKQTFDRLLLQEPVRFGQRISEFKVQVWIGEEWKEISGGSTIGYKRLLRFSPVTTNRVRILITQANNTIALSKIAIFKASGRE